MFNKTALLALAIALLTVVQSDAQSSRGGIGIKQQSGGNMVGGDGAFNVTSGGGSVVIPCSQTGLIFTSACNAILYVVVLN
jgi:hypothetical protein